MKVRFCDFLPLVGLVVVAYLQGCASNPAEVKAAPVKAVENRERLAATAPVVSKEEPVSSVDLPPVVRPEPAAVGQSSPPQASAPAAQPRPQPLPSATAETQPTPPASTAKPQSKPESKPAAKADTIPAAKREAKSAPQTMPSPKPASPQPTPAPVNPEPELVPAVPEVVEKEVEVTLESLPITIHAEWVLSAAGDTCNLSAVPVRFDDGQGMSKLQLVFTAKEWLIKTQSDIDMSYSGTGLTVDEEAYFPLEQRVRESDLLFTRQHAAMTQAFIAGKSLRITLGFWPTWPITETKSIAVSLQHFASAHRAWKQCLSLINGR